MKRSLFIIVCILLTYTDTMAGDRTEQQMRQAAIQVLGRSKARGESNEQLKEFLALSKLKIYGYDGGGFAVVTSDDRFDDVIGYSSSTYTESLPCGFKWWLEAVDNNMQTINVPVNQKSKTRGSSNSAGPLLTTIWGQERPFNDNCTITNGNDTYPCVTGCVATAMAQVMNYYKYPERGTGSNSYDIKYNNAFTITFSEDFSQSVYDWGNMLDDYKSYYFSNKQDSHTKAVAKLMKDCGVSVNMKYSNFASGSNLRRADYAFKTYFLYDEATEYYNRYYYQKKSEWMDIIYDALDKGRPILYGGNESDKIGASGHAFVLHGYDSSGKVLINWGWDGRYDGYFDIDMLNPDGNNFNYQQCMVIAIPGNNAPSPQLFSLNITAIGSGSAYYESLDGTKVREGSQSFQIKEGNGADIILSPDAGYRVKSFKVNNKDVTSAIFDNKYTLSNVQTNSDIVVEFEKIPIDPVIPQCANPSINYKNGEISFSCATEGVKFVSEISVGDAKDYSGSQFKITKIYKVSVYAIKDGYTNSEQIIREIVIGSNDKPIKGDVDGNGVVNEADHVRLSDIIMQKK